MHQDFLPWRAFASAAPAACDPYLPEPDTPLGGEKKPGGEDAVIRRHRAQRVTAAQTWGPYKKKRASYFAPSTRPVLDHS